MAYPVLYNSGDNGHPFVNVVNSRQRVNWQAEVLAGPGTFTIGVLGSPNTFGGTTNQTWLIMNRSVLSFAIVFDQFSMALNVDLSVNGGATWLEAFTFPIGGEGILDPMVDFPLTGSAARFRLVTNVGGTTSGWLELRSF